MSSVIGKTRIALFFPKLGFSKNTPFLKFIFSKASLPSTDDIVTSYLVNETPRFTTGPREPTDLLHLIPKPVASFLEIYIQVRGRPHHIRQGGGYEHATGA